MKLVLKLRRVGLDEPGSLQPTMRAIVGIVGHGYSSAVVHGYGTSLAHLSETLRLQRRCGNGPAVCDRESHSAMLLISMGSINSCLVAALGSLGQPAIGLSGGDDLSFRARRKLGSPDLMCTGEIAASSDRWIDTIWQLGGIPVLSSIALGFDGKYYNVDEDEMATACAIACRADVLVFLTDSPEMREVAGNTHPWLTINQIDNFTKRAVLASDIVKTLRYCRQALLCGVTHVGMLPPRAVSCLFGFLQALDYHG